MPLQSKCIKVSELSVAWFWQSIETEYLHQVHINLKTKIQCSIRLYAVGAIKGWSRLMDVDWSVIGSFELDPDHRACSQPRGVLQVPCSVSKEGWLGICIHFKQITPLIWPCHCCCWIYTWLGKFIISIHAIIACQLHQQISFVSC